MIGCDCLFYRLVKNIDEATTEGDITKLVSVKFDVEWSAVTHHFDFDVDLHPHVLSDAVAREPWTRQFFSTLRAYVSSLQSFIASVTNYWSACIFWQRL